MGKAYTISSTIQSQKADLRKEAFRVIAVKFPGFGDLKVRRILTCTGFRSSSGDTEWIDLLDSTLATGSLARIGSHISISEGSHID